jgi:hypothetical protein
MNLLVRPRRDIGTSARAKQAEAHAREETKKARAHWSEYQWKEAYEAWLVTADAWYEAGDREKAIDARVRAKIIRRRHPSVSPPKYTRKTTARLYKHHRRRRIAPREAIALAKVQREKRIVGFVGDRNWREHDGGPVFKTPGGYELEYVQAQDEDGKRYYVYRIDITHGDIPNWINARHIRDLEISPTIFRKRWLSSNPMIRANIVVDLANIEGWYSFDEEPLRFRRKEMLARYAPFAAQERAARDSARRRAIKRIEKVVRQNS